MELKMKTGLVTSIGLGLLALYYWGIPAFCWVTTAGALVSTYFGPEEVRYPGERILYRIGQASLIFVAVFCVSMWINTISIQLTGDNVFEFASPDHALSFMEIIQSVGLITVICLAIAAAFWFWPSFRPVLGGAFVTLVSPFVFAVGVFIWVIYFAITRQTKPDFSGVEMPWWAQRIYDENRYAEKMAERAVAQAQVDGSQGSQWNP
jgi:hypothetical protein